jgi:ribosomal protein S18 acetylase RimI-like enzyme
MALSGPDRPVGGLSVRAPTGVELRPAGREDLDAVVALLGEREAGPASIPRSDPLRERWDAVIGSVDATPFLAIAEGRPAGLLLLFFRRRLNFATWEGWVPELVVAKAFRRRGIGRALLRVAIEEWRLRGAHRLAVETAPGEDAGRALLSGLGFADAFVRFRQEPIIERGIPPPTDVAIRELGADDFEAVTRLVAEMGPHRSPVPERMDAVRRSFDELIRRPNDASRVAVREGAVMGICTLEIRANLRRLAAEAWIPEIVVTERARGEGIGAALLDSALADAMSADADSATLESGARREVAHALYRAAGFTEAGRIFTLLRDR